MVFFGERYVGNIFDSQNGMHDCRIGWNSLVYIIRNMEMVPLSQGRNVLVFLYPFLRKRGKEYMKAMLSQPMAGKTDEEIIATREKAVKELESRGYKIVNTLFTDDWYKSENMKKRGVVQIPLCFLAKSLENMSLCHAVYFCKGWEQARGCRIEHDAAVAYGLEIIYEE